MNPLNCTNGGDRRTGYQVDNTNWSLKFENVFYLFQINTRSPVDVIDFLIKFNFV